MDQLTFTFAPLALRQLPVEPRIPARPQFVDIDNLPEVVAEVFDDVVDRLQSGRSVNLNRKALQQSRRGCRGQSFEDRVHLTDYLINARDQLRLRPGTPFRKFGIAIAFKLAAADGVQVPLPHAPAE